MSARTSRRRRRLARHRWMGVPVIAALLIAGGALGTGRGRPSLRWLHQKLREPRFQLGSVEFLGLETLDPSALYARTGPLARQPLIDLDVAAASARVCSHPRIAHCTAARIPPDHLVFEIEERKPVARLAGREEGFDLEAVVFPLAPGEAGMLAEVEGRPEWAVPLLRAAAEQRLRLGRVEARGVDDVRFQPDGGTLQVRVGSRPEAGLASWQRLRRSGLLRGYAAHEVDLRFRGSAVLSDFRSNRGGGEDGPQ